jgi:hypothetical protein
LPVSGNTNQKEDILYGWYSRKRVLILLNRNTTAGLRKKKLLVMSNIALKKKCFYILNTNR